jgi:ABC-type antimicrobial peptide transport system permease subunit
LRLALALLTCFSLLGIVVAGLGVYATATLMAAARTREMGIRRALGAPAERIGGLVLWRSVRLALLALPVGALGAWALGLNLSHWLFQVGATDPASYLTSAAILLAVALAAGLWPALRAATVDPSAPLRYDG